MVWKPVYFAPLSNTRVEFDSPGSTSVECPISRLRFDQKSTNMIDHISRAEYLRATMMSHGMGGGSGTITLFGPDLSKWPSYFVDAMQIFMEESGMVDRRLNEIDHPKPTG